MYKSFKVRNFRCFRELELNELELVNLIAGVNNVGKTALLEAIFLHCGTYNPELVLRINAFRGIEIMAFRLGYWIEHPLSSYFNQFDVTKTIELSGKHTTVGCWTVRLRTLEKALQGGASIIDGSSISHDTGEPGRVLSSSETAKVLELEYEKGDKRTKYHLILDKEGVHVDPSPPAPPFQTFFQGDRVHIPSSEQARLYGNLEIRGEQNDVLEALKMVEPRLKRLAVVAVAGGSMLHGDTGMGRLVPLPDMGGVIDRLLNFILYIGNAPNGVVLIDEIENGLHHSIMSDVWKAIALAARQSNTQVFATTRSWECIRAAHEAFTSSEKYDFRLHRLDKFNDEITVVTYSQRSLATSLEAGLEVR